MSLAALASFWALCLAQGAIVLLPGAVRAGPLDRIRRRWVLVAAPAAAVIGATFLPPVAEALGADLSLVALVAVPPLAVAGAAWAIRCADVRLVPLVPLLTVVAWSAPAGALGESAALLLVALSCAALAVLVVAVLPRWLVKAGILCWAATDLFSALADDLGNASRAISEAAPAVAPHALRLQLQRVVIGQSSMEYADLFVAALLGALLVADMRDRRGAASLVGVLAMSLAPFFLVTDVVPGTVPVALTLLLVSWRDARARNMRSPEPARTGRRPHRLPSPARGVAAGDDVPPALRGVLQ